MPYFAPPAKIEISNTPSPSNAVAKAGFGKLWDFCTGLLGATGQPAEAFAAMKLLDSRLLLNLKPTFAVAANALTITFKDKDAVDLSADNPAFVAQRHATVGDGGHFLRKIVANFAMTVSSGSTLGHVSAFLFPIYIYAIDNAGAIEAAVSGTFQGESGIFSTTAEGGAGAADNPDVMYSTTARANVPGRLVAIAWSNQAAAGTWTALPSETKVPPYHLERVGVTEDYKGGTVPYGFLLEDGANVSRTTYAKLFGKIGTAWGVGDGATTFGMPDSRRRVSVGKGGTGTGTLGNAVGNTGGEETHVLTTAELASHAHGPTAATNFLVANIGGANAVQLTGGTPISAMGNSTLTGTAGSGTAHNVIQPAMVVTKMIRWLGDI